MGNTIYSNSTQSNTLIGMTLEKAREYVDNNKVYHIQSNYAYRVLDIRISHIESHGILPNGDVIMNRLNINIENNLITKLMYMG